jgi:hypothetical protein
MPKVDITVNVDFTNVSFQNGAWTGTPVWTITPNTQQVQPGNNKIAWTLTTLNSAQPPQNSVPSGYTAGFTSDGIIFKSTNQQAWNSAPTLDTDGTIQAEDNFRGLSQVVNYYYSTKVQLTPAAGTNGLLGTWSADPDVQNEPGNIMLAAAK